jgi:hypothetical protein
MRDHVQNPAIPLAVNNVIPHLIRPSENAIMYHLGDGTRLYPFTVKVNGHGRVPDPGSLSLDWA